MYQQQITSTNVYDVISRMMFVNLNVFVFCAFNVLFFGFLCRNFIDNCLPLLFLFFGSIIILVKSNAENVTTRHLNSLTKEKAHYEIVMLLASEDVFTNLKHGIECNEIE
ncbi:hypothetical protein ACVWWU_002498 [Pantoea sp. PA1]|nr:hypothetical protein C7422_101290 [Pantoea ananatis]SFX52763.1 hypothetical protein SAMN03097714_2126 [Pantoea ananatis]